MAFREEVRRGTQRFGRWRMARHWYHEAGIPGWTRVWHGYPCLHFADPAFVPEYDRHQELELLHQEVVELEGTLAEVKTRINELEASGSETKA